MAHVEMLLKNKVTLILAALVPLFFCFANFNLQKNPMAWFTTITWQMIHPFRFIHQSIHLCLTFISLLRQFLITLLYIYIIDISLIFLSIYHPSIDLSISLYAYLNVYIYIYQKVNSFSIFLSIYL